MTKREPDNSNLCDSRESLVVCPKCPGRPFLVETWLMRKNDKYQSTRDRPKLLAIVCPKCKYDPASVRIPKGRIIQKQ